MFYTVDMAIDRAQSGKPHRGKALTAIQPHCDDVPIFAMDRYPTGRQVHVVRASVVPARTTRNHRRLTSDAGLARVGFHCWR